MHIAWIPDMWLACILDPAVERKHSAGTTEQGGVPLLENKGKMIERICSGLLGVVLRAFQLGRECTRRAVCPPVTQGE